MLRTCETNIQCLQQILKNIHRSKNSRLNSNKAIEQLQSKEIINKDILFKSISSKQTTPLISKSFQSLGFFCSFDQNNGNH